LPRLLLKLSGEALAGSEGFGIDPAVLTQLAVEIREFVVSGGELGIVLGAGNLLRGATLEQAGMDRVTADHMGMLATLMNALAFRDLLRQNQQPAQVFSAFPVNGIAPAYHRDDAVSLLQQGAVAIFAGGTGNPFFTTDTAACLRGIEIGADAVLKATKVDGVYSADPRTHPDATRYDTLTYHEVLEAELAVMDLPAICLCRDHDMPLIVFDMNADGALTALARGDKVGTRISARGG
jgi:uridylate kinase